MGLLEWLGAIFGLFGVWLATKKNILTWPISIFSTLVYFIVFFESKLYGDMLLQIVFALTAVYGWRNWQKWKGQSVDAISWNRTIRNLSLVWIGISAPVFGYLLKHVGGFLPYLDGITLSLSLLAQWLLAQKIIQNWHVWIIADFLYLYIYYQKQLFPTMLFYGILIILAVIGYWRWRKQQL